MFCFLLLASSESICRFDDSSESKNMLIPMYNMPILKSYTFRKNDLKNMLKKPPKAGYSHYVEKGEELSPDSERYAGLYFKVLEKNCDEHPENEFLCYSLYKALGIERYIAPTILIDITDDDGKAYWIQISQNVGENLAITAKKETDFFTKLKINSVNYSWQILMTFLLHVGDGKAENYIFRKNSGGDYELVSIDQEMNFYQYLEIISVLFFYNDYEKGIDKNVREIFLSFDENMSFWEIELARLKTSSLFPEMLLEEKVRNVHSHFSDIRKILEKSEDIKHSELLKIFSPKMFDLVSAGKAEMERREDIDSCKITQELIFNNKYCLARRCLNEKNYQGAYRYFKIEAQLGHARAMCELGEMYEKEQCKTLKNLSCSDNEKTVLKWSIAIKFYERAAHMGDPKAKFQLGRLLTFFGKELEGRKWLDEAKHDGYNEVGFDPSVRFEDSQGFHEIKAIETNPTPWKTPSPVRILPSAIVNVPVAEYETAFSWFCNHASILPRLDLQFLLQLRDGPALALLEELANVVDDPQAWYYLAFMYANGLGGSKKEINQIIECLKKAADKNYSEAQFSIALLHLKGVGVKKSEQEALAYMKKAAEASHPYAQNFLFMFYKNDMYGFPQDVQQALFWGEKMIAHKSLDVSIVIDFNSWKAKIPPTPSLQELRRMAAGGTRGNPQAQFKLAIIYLEGKGVKKSLQEGLSFLRNAAAQDHQTAIEKLAELFPAFRNM